jgi:hypothetical protein
LRFHEKDGRTLDASALRHVKSTIANLARHLIHVVT